MVNMNILHYLIDYQQKEADLYWKRSTFYLTFLGALFGAYFLNAKPGNYSNVFSTMLIESLGSVIACSWFLTNLGGKHWTNYWISKVKKFNKNIFTGNEVSYYSTLVVSIILSIFVLILWIVMYFGTLYSNYRICGRLADIDVKATALAIFTVLCMIALFYFSRRMKNCDTALQSTEKHTSGNSQKNN
jgi:hypothetical protein